MDNFDKTENICRICLAQNIEDSQSVFNTITDSTGELQQFSEMLMTFANVDILPDDELPDKICSACAQNTNKLYSFKKQCEESDKTLRNRLKKGPFVVINKIDIDEEDIFDKVKSEIKEENVEVSGVLMESGGDGYFAQQNENNQLDSVIYEDCTFLKYSESPNTFNYSIKTENALSIAEESLEEDSSEEKDKNTKNGVAIKSLVICMEDCSKTSSLKSSRKNTYECDVCNKKHNSLTALKYHKRTHIGEKPYECNICKKRFNQSSHLIVHKRTHTGEKRYECDVCKKKFSSSSTFKYHKLIHTGEKPYECDVCKKRFIQSSDLIVHKRSHTGEKPYECDVCKKRYKQSSHLMRHNTCKHTGEKSNK